MLLKRGKVAANFIKFHVKGVNQQILFVVGADNVNQNFRLPSWRVSVYCELLSILATSYHHSNPYIFRISIQVKQFSKTL